MIKKDSLKKLGIVGVSFALMSSPLAFADVHEEDESKAGTRQQPDSSENQDSSSTSDPDGSDQEAMVGADDEPKTGTRQQTDSDENKDASNSSETDGSDAEVIVGEEEPDSDTGTRQESDIDEED